MGPYGSTYGVVTGNNDYSGDGGYGSPFGSGFAGALFNSAVAGSFRVVDRHDYEW